MRSSNLLKCVSLISTFSWLELGLIWNNEKFFLEKITKLIPNFIRHYQIDPWYYQYFKKVIDYVKFYSN